MTGLYHSTLKLIAGAAALAVVTALPFAAQAAQKQVNFYSYADYIDAASVKEFEKATGIRVIYDTFDSISAAEAKLVTGASGYDVVNSDIITLERLSKAGITQKLDKSKLPNWKNLDPIILKKMEAQDPGNQFMVPLFYGIDGVAYNVKHKEKWMKDAPADSLAMIFNPDIVKNFKSCGVNFLDSSADVMGLALIYLGKDPNPKTPADVDAAMEVLWKVRPYITTFDGAGYIDGLANGEMCLSTVFGGDHITAQKKAEAGKTGIKLAYFIPKEGSVAWFDGFFIPKTAKNLDEAHAFLNALMEPKFAAANTNLWNYPNANLASRPMVDKRITDDKAVFLPAAEFVKIRSYTNSPSPQMEVYMTKAWNKLKSNKK